MSELWIGPSDTTQDANLIQSYTLTEMSLHKHNLRGQTVLMSILTSIVQYRSFTVRMFVSFAHLPSSHELLNLQCGTLYYYANNQPNHNSSKNYVKCIRTIIVYLLLFNLLLNMAYRLPQQYQHYIQDEMWCSLIDTIFS